MDRRTFLADTGMGFTGLALSAMLARDGYSSENKLQPQTGRTHFTPKAKNVIWLFMGGGVSHMESFDPKPALNKYAGRLASETPLGDVFDTPFFKENYRKFALGERGLNLRMYPMQVGFRKRGRSGIEICDWWKHLGDCVDDMAIIRSMWTTDLNHSAQAQFHTGRHVIDGCHPSIGSWVSYGLGTRNDNLPPPGREDAATSALMKVLTVPILRCMMALQSTSIQKTLSLMAGRSANYLRRTSDCNSIFSTSSTA